MSEMNEMSKAGESGVFPETSIVSCWFEVFPDGAGISVITSSSDHESRSAMGCSCLWPEGSKRMTTYEGMDWEGVRFWTMRGARYVREY
jgi:hypothetical protein